MRLYGYAFLFLILWMSGCAGTSVKIEKSPESTSESPEAEFLKAKDLFKEHRYVEAYELLKHLSEDDFVKNERVKIFYLLASTAKELGRYSEVVRWNLELLKRSPPALLQSKIQSEIEEVIVSKLTIEEVNQLMSDFSSDAYAFPYLSYRKGRAAYESGLKEEAKRFFEEALSSIENISLKKEVEVFLFQLDRTFPLQKNTVGCILPLSGKYAAFGEKSLKGIQHAFSFFGLEQKGFELAIIDSRGSPESAEKGVETLLEQYGVVAILGPLLMQESEAAARKAQQLQVPLINLSQHKFITEIGDFIYRLAMTKKSQVETLDRFASDEKGYKKFALLYPEDTYGIEFANLFWDKIEASGGTIEGIEAYQANQEDFNDEIKKLVGLHQPKARKELYRQYETQLKSESGKENLKAIKIKLPPQIDFEALFVPDYARTVGQIAPMLPYYDINNVLLLGTEGWHSESLVERGQKYVEGAVFVDGFIHNPLDIKNRDFVNSFKKTFDDMPELWEAQAYDAAMLLLDVLSAGNVESREDVKHALESISEFEGVSGHAVKEENHDFKKNVFLLTIKNGEIKPFRESD